MSRNRGCTTCKCGLTLGMWPGLARRSREDLLSEDDYFAAIGWPDSPLKNNGGRGWNDYGETRFFKAVCPLCRTEFAGWYFLTPWSADGLWDMFDTSYWSTFDQVHGESDVLNRRDPVEVLKAAEAFLKAARP